MKQLFNTSRLVLALVLAGALLAGCENDGPAEQLGENIDDATDEIRDAGEDIGNEIEDACEDVKEGAGADDTDC